MIPTVTSEGFSLQSSANLILPHETSDEAVRRYVLTVCSRALVATQTHRLWLYEATKRYEAMRSTRSLDRDDPGIPWLRASNTGLPMEAITGEALVPRLNAATVDAPPPIFRVKYDDPALQEFEESASQWYHEALTRSMRLRKVRDETHRNVIIDGDAIEETSFETKYQQTATTVCVRQNAKGELLTGENGQPLIYQANLPPDAVPEDPLVPGRKLKKLLIQNKGSRPIYDGPMIRTWRVLECIWPEEATTPDINELDWFAVQMWKSPSWFKTREGDPIDGKLKNVEELLLRLRMGIPSHLDTDLDRGLTVGIQFPQYRHKILVWRFFGLFDVDRDGIDEEVMAMVAPRERLLLGWRLSKFQERPFSHYQLFKMPGLFTGRGLPHLSRGIRDIVDFKINQSNNRESLGGNPPILYEIDSGFDPDLHRFGVGATWGPLNSGGINKIRSLELPKSQEQITIEFIQFYIGVLQRLTGINDFNLGNTQGALPGSVKTLGGQQLITQEGNIKFADFITDFQDTNERQVTFIDREYVQSGLVNEQNITQISGVQIPLEVLSRPKRLKSTGNSMTMNRQARQEIAILIFERFAQDALLQGVPQIQRQIRQAVLDAFDQSVKLPSVEEIKSLQQDQLLAAIRKMPPEEQQAIFAGLIREASGDGQPTGQPTGAVNGRPVGQPAIR